MDNKTLIGVGDILEVTNEDGIVCKGKVIQKITIDSFQFMYNNGLSMSIYHNRDVVRVLGNVNKAVTIDEEDEDTQ